MENNNQNKPLLTLEAAIKKIIVFCQLPKEHTRIVSEGLLGLKKISPNPFLVLQNPAYSKLCQLLLEFAKENGHVDIVKALSAESATKPPKLSVVDRQEIAAIQDRLFEETMSCMGKIEKAIRGQNVGPVEPILAKVPAKWLHAVPGATANYTALHLAAMLGNVQMVRLFLKKDPTLLFVTIVGQKGMTALYVASSAGHTDVVKTLLEENHDGSLLFVTVEHGDIPLHVATKEGHAAVVETLLKHPRVAEQLAAKSLQGRTALHEGAIRGHLSTVQVLVEKDDSQLLVLDDNGAIALHLAVQKGHIDVVRFLLAQRSSAQLAMKTATGHTPLHIAVDAGHSKIAKMLLEKDQEGSQLLDPDNDGVIPLYAAVSKENADIIKILLQRRAFEQLVTKAKGFTILYQAAGKGRADFVEALLEKDQEGSQLLEPSNDGIIPLHSAAGHGHLEVVRVLLKSRAAEQLAAKFEHDCTALDLAAQNGWAEVVEVLLEKDESGSQPLVTRRDGGISLHLAAQLGHAGVISTLLKHSSAAKQLTAKLHGSHTALHLAAQNGHAEAIKALLEVDKEGTQLLVINSERTSPLHLAAQDGHVDAVRILLQQHAAEQLAVKNYAGHIAFHLAASKGYVDVLRVLLEQDESHSQLAARTNLGVTALHLAVLFNQEATVHFLLTIDTTNKLGINAILKNGATLLHYAAATGKLSIVKHLLDSPYINVLKKDGVNGTAHDCALKAKPPNPAIISLLMAAETKAKQVAQVQQLTVNITPPLPTITSSAQREEHPAVSAAVSSSSSAQVMQSLATLPAVKEAKISEGGFSFLAAWDNLRSTCKEAKRLSMEHTTLDFQHARRDRISGYMPSHSAVFDEKAKPASYVSSSSSFLTTPITAKQLSKLHYYRIIAADAKSSEPKLASYIHVTDELVSQKCPKELWKDLEKVFEGGVHFIGPDDQGRQGIKKLSNDTYEFATKGQGNRGGYALINKYGNAAGNNTRYW